MAGSPEDRRAAVALSTNLSGQLVQAAVTMLTVEDALNAIWRVKRRRPLAQRVLVFWAVLTLGPVLIFSMFVLFLALTAVYVSRANGEFDAMTHALVEDAARGGRS